MSNISVKPKTLGLLFALVGIALFLRATASAAETIFFLNPGEAFVETILYTVGDIAFFIAAIALWIVSAKLMKAKNSTV